MQKDKHTQFDRRFFSSENRITYIGNGGVGGKGKGLIQIEELLSSDNFNSADFPQINVKVPYLTIIRTDIFDQFMEQNKLYDLALSGMPDDRIAHTFQKASLPFEILGDLRALMTEVESPLAIRSSSNLEDAMFAPFAGIYGTKMIPNNQADVETRFKKLIEAIKFVYASTFFHSAKEYINATEHSIKDEKMAVVIQEVIGHRYQDRFYPTVSGVAKSYNFYPSGDSKSEDGVISLALGLGKTIVDGGISWFFSPKTPQVGPPFGSIGDMLKGTQLDFWSVNMGKPPSYNPILETEYLLNDDITKAEADGILKLLVSTLDNESGRLIIGIGKKGPRALTFAPILNYDRYKLNELIKHLIKICEEKYKNPVEMEFAITIDKIDKEEKFKFGFLQVRPMVVSDERIEINKSEIGTDNLLLASENVIGNGIIDNISDIIYIKPEAFDVKKTREMATEINLLNSQLVNDNKQYLLIGFGRWGTTDEWSGIPIDWGQISGAKAIVEIMLEGLNFDISQGSHFFHNLTAFKVVYFSNPHNAKYTVDWKWLSNQTTIKDYVFARHIITKEPIIIKVDTKNKIGIINKKS